jgi:hypothetical protein
VINPNRVHRAKAIVEEIGPVQFRVRLIKNRAPIIGFDMPKGIQVGDLVNIQASFSITLDQYVVRTVRKPRK